MKSSSSSEKGQSPLLRAIPFGGSWLVAATGVVLTAFLIAQAVLHQYTFVDDAFITFRYADHLLSGAGPVFNPNERVEGFTSPLWLALLSGAGLAGMDLPHAATLLAMAFAVGTLWLFLYFPALETPAPVRAGVAAFLCLHPFFVAWVTSGMETFAFTFFSLAAAFAFAVEQRADRLPVVSGLLSGLAILARPEGLLLLAAPLLLRTARARATFLAASLPLPLAWLAVRVAFFGTLLPNTAQAKLGLSVAHLQMGLDYIARFWADTPASLVALVPVLALLWRQRDAASPLPGAALFAFVLLHHFYFLAVGGDYFDEHRFFIPLFPWIGLLVGAGLHRLWELTAARGRPWGVAAMILWTALAVTVADGRLVTPVHGNPWVIGAGKLGLSLRRTFPSTTRVASSHIGALGFYSGLFIIDPMGLTEPAVANARVNEDSHLAPGRLRLPGHEKYDVDHTLSRRPDLFVFLNGASSTRGTHLSEIPRQFAVEYALLDRLEADPAFVLHNIPIDEGAVYMVAARAAILEAPR